MSALRVNEFPLSLSGLRRLQVEREEQVVAIQNRMCLRLASHSRRHE